MKHSFLDKYSDLGSIIHRLDPRVKLTFFFVLILVIVSTPPQELVKFSGYFLILLILVLLSRIPLPFVFVRSLVIIPFVLLTAIFIPFFKGGEVAGSYNFLTLHLTISHKGILIFQNILIKSWLSVLSLTILTSTTKFSSLLKALEILKIPRVMILIASFFYRYMFLLVDELMRIKNARDSRSFKKNPVYQFKVIGYMIGELFIRTYERAERIYLAMLSRGFNGTIYTLESFKI
ncbi:cobalt ECF transporter T component CbiQ, partial [bacterium]|nr:cobalt ECF transporter T component CbiQ [bacterium]